MKSATITVVSGGPDAAVVGCGDVRVRAATRVVQLFFFFVGASATEFRAEVEDVIRR